MTAAARSTRRCARSAIECDLGLSGHVGDCIIAIRVFRREMLQAGFKLGPYEIVAPLGSGGMGEVYRAHDARLGRDVAVKVLPVSFASDADRLRRFELEARAAAAVTHPNLLAVFDIGTEHGVTFIVSELLDGRTLRGAEAGGPILARKAIEWTIAIAEGLAAAHEKGIVHRDLKPENVFITSDGRVKILDFGLAKLAQLKSADGSATSLSTRIDTTPGMVLGTVGYMSPEQVRGEAVDARSDIFSLGVILYEMLSGQRAFAGATPVDMMSAILHAEPPELSQSKLPIPESVERIVRHCLEKNAAQRFQSARDLAFALNTLTTASGTAAHAPQIQRRGRRWWLIGAAAVGASAVLAGSAALANRIATARGNGPSLPTFTQLTFQRGRVQSARFTPDGQSVVYSAAWNGRPYELFSTRVEAPESRPLGVGAANLFSISHSGEMAVELGPALTNGLFGYKGTLARVPIVGGPPREILEDVSDADWSADGSQFAIIREPSQGQTPASRRVEYPVGTMIFETPVPSWISHLRVSPDGRRVAFLHHPVAGDDGGEVIVSDASGKPVTRSAGWSTVQGMAWRPDGSELWFTAAKTGGVRVLHGLRLSGEDRVLLRMPSTSTLEDIARDGRVLLTTGDQTGEVRGVLAGAEQEEALSSYDWATTPAVSRDGSMVTYTESGEAVRTYGIYLRRAGAAYPVRLGDGGGPAAISADGRWVAVMSQDARTLRLLPIGAGAPREVLHANIERYVRVDWFPDSQRLLLTATATGSKSLQTFVQPIDGEPKAVQRNGALPSPDGKRFICRQAAERGTCDLETDQFTPIPGSRDLTAVSGWASDGDAVYASIGATGSQDVYRVSVKTGARSLVRRLELADPAGLVLLSPPSLSADGKAYAYTVTRIMSQLFVISGLQ
jgi:WD40 repeat protein